MLTAGFIILPSLCTTSVRICVWVWTVQEMSYGNQSSLNAASRDMLHLKKIIIRQPFILCNFLRGVSLCQTTPPSQRVILSLEDKPVFPWRHRLEKDTCHSCKLVTLPTESSHFCVITEMLMFSDKSKRIPFQHRKKCLFQRSVDYPMGLSYCVLCLHNIHSLLYLCNYLGNKCHTRHSAVIVCFFLGFFFCSFKDNESTML